VKHWTASAAIFACLLSLGACGSGNGAGRVGESTRSDKEQIQQLFATYNSAMEARRFDEVCSMNTPEFNDELVVEARGMFGDHRAVTCERALGALAASGYQAPPLRSIVVSGATATGQVGPSSSKWRFARVGSAWKVAYAN
jgi:hypothetical protein